MRPRPVFQALTAGAWSLLLLLVVLPVTSFFLHVPIGELVRRIREPVVLDALRLSLFTATTATVIVAVLGLPVAYALATKRFVGKRVLEVLIDLPMVLPPVVAGVGLLLAFGRTGIVGRWLNELGITIAFSTVAVVLAQIVVAAPFFINAARAGFESVPERYRAAAEALRASPGFTFTRVALPLALPAVVSGVAMTWARALGEFGATITFAGNLPGVTQTMPLAVFTALQSDLEAAITLSIIQLGLAFVLLVAFRASPGLIRRR